VYERSVATTWRGRSPSRRRAFQRSYRDIDSKITSPDVSHLISDERIIRPVLESCGESTSRGLILRYLAIHRNEVWSSLRKVDGLTSMFASLRRRNLKLGVLTDGTTYEQHIILARLGLLKYVDEIVTSEEMGESKPSGAMFAAILGRLDVKADRALMVGDNWKRDIEGARAVGMVTAYLSQENAPGETDLLIRNVRDLEQVLSVLQLGPRE
jgi:FMN phosphatase YigB (HAD superfamily)